MICNRLPCVNLNEVAVCISLWYTPCWTCDVIEEVLLFLLLATARESYIKITIKTSKAWENFKCDRYWSILLRDKPLTFKLKTVNFQSDLINLRMHIHLKKTQKNNANFSWIWPIKNNITFVFITLCCHICTVVEETNVLNRPLSHIYGGLIPLLVIAFICLQFYHYWRWLAVPPDAFWRALCELEMCAPGVMEAPLGTT